MNLLIQPPRIIGTATDEYTGPEFFVTAPDDFDVSRIAEYRYENDELIAPVILDPWQQKRTDLAAIRYQHETAGITLNGMAIATDRESQALITGAWSYSQLNPNVLIDWKAATGWIQIDAATISVIAAVVAGHVQACFSNERALSAAIDAATTIEELNTIDLNDNWP